MSEFVKETTDTSFDQEVLKAETPVLVDFWAAWCGPCRMVAPILEQVGEKFQGKAKIVKVNVDENTMTPQKYGIRGIPTLIVFKDGKEVARQVGAASQNVIERLIEAHS